MDITVRDILNKTVLIRVARGETVQCLKNYIQDRWGIRPEGQRLIAHGVELTDELAPLGDCGPVVTMIIAHVAPPQIIQLRVRTPVGQIFVVDAELTDTWGDVLRRVSEKKESGGSPVEQLAMYHCQSKYQVLNTDSSVTLSDCNVVQGDLVRLQTLMALATPFLNPSPSRTTCFVFPPPPPPEPFAVPGSPPVNLPSPLQTTTPGDGVSAEAAVRARAKFQQPSVSSGVFFLARLSVFLTFVTILTFSVLQDRLVSSSYTFLTAVTRTMETPELAGVTDLAKAVSYIKTVAVRGYVRSSLRWNRNYTGANDSLAFGGSAIVTGLRFRQHRVNEGCVRQPWRDKFGPCHPDGLDGKYSQEVFRGVRGKTVYPYREVHELCGEFSMCSLDIVGNSPGTSYPGGGYVVDIPSAWFQARISAASKAAAGVVSKEQIQNIANEAVQFMYDEPWVDVSTRVIIVEFSLMMSNLPEAMFASAALMFEFPAEGSCYASFSVIPFKLRLDPTLTETILLIYAVTVAFASVCNIIKMWTFPTPCVVCLVDSHEDDLKGKEWYACKNSKHCSRSFDRTVYETCPTCDFPIQEWTHVCFLKGGLLDAHRVVTWLNMAILVATYILRVSVRRALEQRFKAFEDFNNGVTGTLPYMDFHPAQARMSVAFALSAFNLILTYVGIYTYLWHFETFAKFLRVFRYGARHLFTFILTFLVPFFAFAVTFHVAFGTRTNGFQTPFKTLHSTFRMANGDLSFADLKGDSDGFSFVIFCLFMIFVVLVGLNVFIAIINAGFAKAVHRKHNHALFESLILVGRWLRCQKDQKVDEPPPPPPPTKKDESDHVKDMKALVAALRSIQDHQIAHNRSIHGGTGSASRY